MKRFISIAVAVMLTVSAAAAQDSRFPAEPQAYGTKDEFIYNINPSDFTIRLGAWVAGDVTTDSIGAVPGSSWLYPMASIHLPTGALMKSVTIHYFDDNVGAELAAGVFRVSATGETQTLLPTDPAPFAGGARSQTFIFSPPHEIDNAAYHYEFGAALNNDGAGQTRIYRVQIKYQLQVRPAPATATFADVPATHPFFQFIEALAASGVTAGCSAPPNPNYCPNDPITRGQMAVFLARALGLHYPN